MQKKHWILIIIIFLMLSKSGIAQISTVRNQLYIGARPIAMGETFVAIADDGNAVYWNPAGLPAIDRYEINTMYANLYNTGINNNYMSAVFPYSDRLAFGLDWFNIGLDDDGLAFTRNKFNFSLGVKLWRGLSVGANVKRLMTDAKLDDYSQGNATGWGADVGVLFSAGQFLKILRGLKLGVMAHDFTNTRVRYDNGVSEAILNRNIRYGLSYEFKKLLFFERPLIAMDFDDRIHLGTELWLPEVLQCQIGVRSGLQKDNYSYGEDELTYSFGAGLRYQFRQQYLLSFDYSYTDSPALLNTSRFSIGFSFALPVSPVRIDNVHIDDIFASLYPYHSENRFGAVRCTYHDARKLDVDVQLVQPDYDIFSETSIVLNPEMQPEDTAKTVDLVPNFSHKILDARGEDVIHAEVVVNPKTLMRTKSERMTSNEFRIYGVGKINWMNGEEQVAAFITPEDPIIRDLAVDIIGRHRDAAVTVNESICYANHIYNFLGRYGISYIGDIESNYRQKSIDTIYYPRELLAKKMGDCDDTTVLMASLLQSIRIPTALACTHDHIFLLFDTGIHRAKRMRTGLPPEMYHIKNNTLWLPVETTWFGKSFLKGWDKGAELMREYAQASDLKIVEVADAGKKYRPIPVKALESIMSTPQVISQIYDKDSQDFRLAMKQRREKYIRELEATVSQHPDSSELRNELATIYGMNRDLTKARFHYQVILDRNPSNFSALNNLGNTYFLEGKIDSASNYYLLALENARTATDSNGVYLNLGTIYAAIDSMDLTYQMYGMVIRDMQDSTQIENTLMSRVENLLGLSFDNIELTRADEQRILKRIDDKKVKKAVKETVKKKEKKDQPKGKKVSKPSVTKQRRPGSEIEDVFYWSF